MSRRTSGTLATFALIASGLVALGGSTPAAAVDNVVPYCSAPAAPPCLISFTRDTAKVNAAQYRLEWQEQMPGSGFYSWYVERWDGSFWQTAMGDGEYGHTFAMELDFGTFNPRTFGALANPETSDPVVWTPDDAAHHKILISASPISESVGCIYDPPDANTPTCPTTAIGDIPGLLFGVVNNGDWIGDTEAQHELSNGTSNFRNTEIGEGTPLLGTDSAGNPTMVFQLANAHQTAAHTTFVGEQHVRLPNDVLRVELGIPDPDTMTWSSLVATVSGSTTGAGTVHMTPESSHDAMRIDLTGVTFSNRKVTIKAGIIKPTAPTALTGKRKTTSTGFLDWDKSLPRGARPTSYQSKCYTPGQSSIITTSHYTYMTVTGLKSGKHYSCTVRARSKIGYSSWSSSVGRL
ncbi:MAG: fibronectin type III domain-containing protein [Marmoricola sp.]